MIVRADGDQLRCIAPKGVLTPEIRAELARHKSELLKILTPVSPAIPIRRNRDSAAVSPAQQRLWVLDRIHGPNAAYNEFSALRVTGELDASCLERSLGELVSRHESLRTVFAEEDGQVLQRVLPRAELRLQRVDLARWASERRDAELERICRREAEHPFDLSQGPLLRATLVKLEEQGHALLLATHHIVFDGWSMGIFVREWSALYEAFRAGRPSSLPPLQVQPADVAAWQQAQLAGGMWDSALSYWKRQLEGAVPLLEFPTDRPRPAVQSFRGGCHGVLLSAEQTGRVREFSRSHGVTPFMSLLSVFATLLGRYTGASDVVIGTPVANRPREEMEALIGFFVNTLPLRLDLGGDPSFAVLLERVKQACTQALSHQEAPLDLILQQVRPERSRSHAPLFQVLFVLQNTPLPEWQLRGLEIEPLPWQPAAAKYDLTLAVEERADRLEACWEYNSDLFDKSTIERMARHWEQLLQSGLEHPQERLSRLPLVSAEERRQLLHLGDRGGELPLSAESLHETVSRQALARPDDVAVQWGAASLRYADLERQSNQLAHALRARGVQPEVPVGLLLERSFWQVIGLLGILKAGGAYVPLDPRTPRQRTCEILRDAGVPLLLTQRELLPSTGLGDDVVPLCVNEDLLQPYSIDPPQNLTRPQHLAYIIFTSGSTGKPKGVMIEHRSIATFTRTIAEQFELTETDRALQFAPVAFDVAAEETYPCLSQGGTLVLPTFGPVPSVQAFLEEVHQQQLTVLDLPTSYWNELVRHMVECQVQLPNCVRLVVIGGEAATVEVLREWLRITSRKVRLINAYGPTETTVEATLWNCPADSGDLDTVPIGRPLPGVEAYVLDQQLEPVPTGIPGELFVGGTGLARGYCGREDLTRQRFVPHPFRGGADRLYRTGDRCRWRSDGTLEFVGRTDKQLKIRGYRVEPTEIETRLCEHPDVIQAAVVPSGGPRDTIRLIAYVEIRSPSSLSQLPAFLQDKLPAYMVPARFLQVTAIPRTLSGKLDRTALPKVAAADPPAELPTTATQQAIADIWCDLLQVPAVGINDNFFEIGGDSLLAVQFVGRLRTLRDIEIPVKTIFQYPRIAELAGFIDGRQGGFSAGRSGQIKPVERTGPLPASPAHRQLFALHRLEAGSAYHMFLALRLTGELDASCLERSLGELVSRHESLRTVFVEEDGQVLQRILPRAELRLQRVDLARWASERRDAELERICRREAEHPFDLSQGPLLRATLVKLEEQSHALLLATHHIVFDGWSMGIFVREWSALYEAFRAGRPSSLPPLQVQPADVAAWQQAQLAGGMWDSALSYWKRQLEGAVPLLEFPTDRPRPAVQSFRGGCHGVLLSAEQTGRVREFSRSHGVTPFMSLLSVFATLLGRYTGASDVVIGTPVANRPREEMEALIGFFVNTLPLRLDLGGDPSFAVLLERVKQACTQALSHQEAPLDLILQQVRPERSRSHAPLFQVLFVLQNTPLPEWQLTGLEIEPLPWQPAAAKYDLTLAVEQRADRLEACWEYNSDLFDKSTIERMARHWEQLLQSGLEHPQERLSRLPLVSAEERRQLLHLGDRGGELPLSAESLHETVSRQALARPDDVAVQWGAASLRYADLERQSNQLAHALRARGVQPEVPVGLLLERSFWQVIGLLGILKAGGAYVPLDPRTPRQRTCEILRDAGVPLLLTQRELLPPTGLGDDVVPLCVNEDLLRPYSIDPPQNLTRPQHLAYIIFTSGSTGKPKGVMIEHQSICDHLTRARQAYGICRSDRILQFASISFDASLEQVGTALTSGATLVLPTEHVWSVVEFHRLVNDQQLTVVNVPPAFVDEWTELLQDESIPGRIRLLIIGGDLLRVETVRRLRRTVGTNLRVLNAYGPTEATITSSVFEVDLERATSLDQIPIGHPLPGTQAYVLDASHQLVPIGVPGELYLGGRFLARGYCGHETTQASFPEVSVVGGSPTRLYRTGDAARMLPDGTLDFLGRCDRQVKIRGYRVEPGEIESALNSCEAVKQSAVVAQTRQGSRVLVAYYVPQSAKQPPQRVELRRYLRQRLPDFMIPHFWCAVESLPRLSSGKLDSRQLAARYSETADLNAEAGLAPSNELERHIASVWREALRLEQVSRSDNFFELGGHSLLAGQVVNRVSELVKRRIPLRSLIDTPALWEWAEWIAENRDRLATESNRPNLADEARQAAQIKLTGSPGPPPPVQSVLLTGATGFLGIFLLEQLLQQTSARVYCLVRAEDAMHASQRLRATARQYGVAIPPSAGRVIPLPGDLSQPMLALRRGDYDRLARNADLIVHGGAWVHFGHSYARLKAANVLGTQEVLRLASVRGNVPVHHVSTMSVAPSATGQALETFPDDTHYRDGTQLEDGYSQSKWVAEHSLAAAHRCGLPVSLYRVGRVIGHSRSGIWNADDFASLLLQCCLSLGAAPDLGDVEVDVIPVDHVSHCIVRFILQASPGNVYHLYGSDRMAWNEVVQRARQAGFPVERVPLAQWHGLVRRFAQEPRGNRYAVLSDLIPTDLRHRPREVAWSDSRTQGMLEQWGIRRPATSRCLGRCLKWLYDNGLVKPATSERV